MLRNLCLRFWTNFIKAACNRFVKLLISTSRPVGGVTSHDEKHNDNRDRTCDSYKISSRTYIITLFENQMLDDF